MPNPPRFAGLEPPERALPRLLTLYVWLGRAQASLPLLGVGAGMLLAALVAGERSNVLPSLLFLGMGAIVHLAGRAARRQRLWMLRFGRLATATVSQVDSNAGAGDYRSPWSMRLAFTGPDGRERRTSFHAERRRGLREGAEVELFYDPETPPDTTPEGERPRVPEHRWPLLALELPRGVHVGPDGRLARPGLPRVAALLVGFAVGLALPLSALLRAWLNA